MANDLEKNLINETEDLVKYFNEQLKTMLLSKRKLKSDSKVMNSFSIEKNESSLFVGSLNTDYFYYVVHGRGPGRFPPPNSDGTWPLPYPAAFKLAKEGNLQKMKPVADSFDKIFNELKEKIKDKVGPIMLAYILKNGVIDVKKEITIG